jgi:hypothetical protein
MTLPETPERNHLGRGDRKRRPELITLLGGAPIDPRRLLVVPIARRGLRCA